MHEPQETRMLGDPGDDRAVDPLIEQLGNAPSPGELTLLSAWQGDWRDRWETPEEFAQSLRGRPRDSAAFALGRVGGKDVIAHLVDYFDRREAEIWEIGPVETDTQVMNRERTLQHVGDLAAATFERIGKPARAPLLARAANGDRRRWWYFDAIASVADARTAVRLRKLMHDRMPGASRWGRINQRLHARLG